MNEMYLKLALVGITSLVVFAYMQYLQKKKEEKADKIFQQTMEAIAKKYDQMKDKKDV